ncbi:MAG: hypothetical protein IKV97_01605 [Clostridia bacterium]|nr:hypothetical protein [Clostridia bacterium]
MKKILIAAVSVLSLTLCSCSLIFNLSPLESESIGIIGGADGPTSIIVATPDKDETVTAKFPETTTVSPATNDEWGILCYAEDVTPEGATINFEQSGGNVKGELQTGEPYTIEVLKNGGWEAVPTVIPEGEYAWTMPAYLICKNSTTEFEVKWEWLYGKLSCGTYRISKQVSDYAGIPNPESKTYYAEFTITE